MHVLVPVMRPDLSDSEVALEVSIHPPRQGFVLFDETLDVLTVQGIQVLSLNKGDSINEFSTTIYLILYHYLMLHIN